ncbi:MAG: 1-deoxy-D-xylulose-5-phosphate reductoisomerase [Sporomusaceae bacterium]|jgi:1-deoxy-D-xylulose-5-phosphate reductoisomerase|nr:1-deoxy-D-xylulose-5-phosphate reductoisomerase [Sporomusaceae bacterium]
MEYVSILGSTGSIGTQALEVIAAKRNIFGVAALASFQNDTLLAEQIEIFKPKLAVLVDKKAADRLSKNYHGPTTILSGEEGLIEAAVEESAQTVLTAVVGFAGLKPTLAAIEAGKNIALANKETLVAAGELVMRAAVLNKVRILPVDSEHSAIFQCLQGERREQAEKIILTASGGPFRGKKTADLQKVTVADCLNHPNWVMGAKITVDSATMANKGLEVIESKWLFGLNYEQIEVCVHPQSIIHSLVEFKDGSVMAQMGKPDMRLPIQYALTYPERLPSNFSKLDFKKMPNLTFEEPDTTVFTALALAFEAGRAGGTMPCVYNAANETAVYAFLEHKIGFLDIASVIEKVMGAHKNVISPQLDDIFAADAWARECAQSVIGA